MKYLSIINDLISRNKRENRDLTWVYNIWHAMTHLIISNTNSIINPNRSQTPWDSKISDAMSRDSTYDHWNKFNYIKYMKNKFKVVYKRAISNNSSDCTNNLTRELDMAFEIFLEKKMHILFDHLGPLTSYHGDYFHRFNNHKGELDTISFIISYIIKWGGDLNFVGFLAFCKVSFEFCKNVQSTVCSCVKSDIIRWIYEIIGEVPNFDNNLTLHNSYNFLNTKSDKDNSGKWTNKSKKIVPPW